MTLARPVTIALGQIRPALGDVKVNLLKHIDWIAQAKQRGASLIVFPELGLTGYQVQDLTLEVARSLNADEIQQLVRASVGIDVVFSFVEEQDDHLFYVASIYASDGSIVSVHRKVYLPTYGMFDEGRYFASGTQFEPFPTRFGKAGMLICEDAWHMSSPYLLTVAGATLIIVPASSPARSVSEPDTFGSQQFWSEMVRVYAQLLGVNIVFVNRVGFEDGVSFFGGSGVVSARGEWLTNAPVLEESLGLCTLDLDNVRTLRFESPMVRDEKTGLVLQHLSRVMGMERGLRF